MAHSTCLGMRFCIKQTQQHIAGDKIILTRSLFTFLAAGSFKAEMMSSAFVAQSQWNMSEYPKIARLLKSNVEIISPIYPN